jgi:glc operon protein GlcG
MNLDCARIEALLSGAREAAEADGLAVAIAIADASGLQAGFLRMPDAFLVATDMAIDKAWCAAGTRMSTAMIGGVLQSMGEVVHDGMLRRPRLTQIPGGLPIMHGDACIGGIGVSGGSAEQDVRIAEAALAAIGEAQ